LEQGEGVAVVKKLYEVWEEVLGPVLAGILGILLMTVTFGLMISEGSLGQAIKFTCRFFGGC